jgi:DNA-binding protein HU-beta
MRPFPTQSWGGYHARIVVGARRSTSVQCRRSSETARLHRRSASHRQDADDENDDQEKSFSTDEHGCLLPVRVAAAVLSNGEYLTLAHEWVLIAEKHADAEVLPVTKGELVETIASISNLSKTDAERALNAFIASVQSAVADGDKVTLPGFGTFAPSARKARSGMNPESDWVSRGLLTLETRMEHGKYKSTAEAAEVSG